MALTDDPKSLKALTLGHFLIRQSLVSVSKLSLLDINEIAFPVGKQCASYEGTCVALMFHDYLHQRYK